MGLLSFFGLTDKRVVQAAPSQESLSHDADNDEWFKTDPSTGFTYLRSNSPAGVLVNEQKALTYSACWAATMLIMTAVGSLPLKLFRKLPGGGSQPAVDDPRYSLVHDTPNPDMTAMLFRGSRTAHQVNWGNGFAEIERNRAGMPVALHPIHPSRIPVDNNIKRGRDGRLKYTVLNDGGGTTEIRSENILHIPSPMSDDGIVGKGVVTHARLSIAFGIAAETHGAAYFGNSARPHLVLEGAKFKKAEDQEEFRRQWIETHGGPARNAKPGIIPPDTKLHVLQFNASDSQFLESRQFSIEDIARWYGVPPHAIGHLLRATNNNIEQQALELRQYALMRWTVPFEQELNRKLLTPEERKTMEFLHVFEGLERADIKTRTDALKEQFFNGEITLNEWRALENRPGIGALGDLHFVQQAMVPLEIAAKGPQTPTDPNANKGATESEEMRQRMETYGIGVRAGSITPQLDDEEQYRQALGLPPMTNEAKAAWTDDKGIRRQITLRDPNAPANPFQQGPPDKPPDEKPEDEPEPKDDGLSALREQFAAVEQAQRRLASAMLRDVMGQMLSVEINAVKRIAAKPSKFDQRLQEFYDKHKATMARSLSEPVAVVLTATGDVRQPAEVVELITSSHVTESLRQLNELTTCTGDELFGKVEERLATWHDERASVSV